MNPRRKEKQVAQKVNILFIDDIDGSEAKGTVKFGLDGTGYEIDLSKGNEEALYDALGPFIEKARKITAPRPGPQGRTRRSERVRAGTDLALTMQIRAWAKENGYDIKDRGRVPADIAAKYQAVH